MLCPSNTIPHGVRPTGNVPNVEPSDALNLVTELLSLFVIQTNIGSVKSNASRFFLSGEGARILPSIARSLVTVLPNPLAAHMFAPSKAMPSGVLPTENVPTTAPSRVRILLTDLLPELAIQMSSPSNAMAVGPFTVLKVPNLCPLLARNLLTVASGKFVTQMLDPSKAAAHGACPSRRICRVPLENGYLVGVNLGQSR
jgi:hypothetical protein